MNKQQIEQPKGNEPHEDTFCYPCLKAFTSNHNLKSHNQRVHEPPKIEWTNCEVCKLKLPITPNDRLMNTHLRVYHS